MPTCRSKSGRWPELRHRTPSRGDTEQRLVARVPQRPLIMLPLVGHLQHRTAELRRERHNWRGARSPLRVGQVPAGQRRRRLRGPRQRAALRARPCAAIVCARLGAGHLRGLLARMMAVVPAPCATMTARRFRVVRLASPTRGLRHRGVRPAPPGPGRFEPPSATTSTSVVPSGSPCSSTARCSTAPGTRPRDASPPRSSPVTPPPSSRSTTSRRRPRPI